MRAHPVSRFHATEKRREVEKQEPKSAPLELDIELLKHIAGGGGSDASAQPVALTSSGVRGGPNGGW